MNIHNNTRLMPIGRERIVLQVANGQTAAARAAVVCSRTLRKWVARDAIEGVAGLQGRSSRPKRLHRPTPQAVIARIGALRLQRLTSKAIAQETGVSPATVSRGLEAVGLNRLSASSRPRRCGATSASSPRPRGNEAKAKGMLGQNDASPYVCKITTNDTG